MQLRNVSESSKIADEAMWSQLSTTLPAFMKWIEEEEAMENSIINEV
jgi:hypothetical protein